MSALPSPSLPVLPLIVGLLLLSYAQLVLSLPSPSLPIAIYPPPSSQYPPVAHPRAATQLVGGPLSGINTTVRDHVKWFFWPPGVQLDGEDVDPGQVGVEWDLTAVPWLSYDSSTRFLSGVTPDSFLNGTAEPIEIPLNLTLPDATPYPTSIELDIHPYHFLALSLPQLNYSSASLNQSSPPLNYSFAPYMRDPESPTVWVEAFLDPTEAGQWLNLTAGRTGLFGIPPNTSYDSVNVELLAWDMASNLTSTASLLIQLRPNSTDSANPSLAVGSGSTGLSDGAKIALIATLCGVAFLLLLALLLFCLCRRRRRGQEMSVREKGIGKPWRQPSTLPPPAQPTLSSAASSPTLCVNSPHADGEKKEKGKVMYGSAESAPGFDHSRSHTPVDQLRTMYPNAFLPEVDSPPDDSYLASESNETYLRAPGVTLTPHDMRDQFGVTASGSEQVRMIDEAVRNSTSDRHMSSELGDHADEARRSRFMDFFDPRPGAAFKGHVAVTPHDSMTNESISNGIIVTPRGLVPHEGEAWQGRQYDAFGKLIKAPTQADLWAAASEPRALGQPYGGDGDSNPFGEAHSASSLGLDDLDPGFGEYSDEDDDGSGETMEGDSHSDPYEGTEVRQAKVVDVSDERYLSTGTPRVIYTGDRWDPRNDSGLPDPQDSLPNLDYPISTLFSPSMSVRLIHPAGPALSPDSVSTARLGQTSIFPAPPDTVYSTSNKNRRDSTVLRDISNLMRQTPPSQPSASGKRLPAASESDAKLAYDQPTRRPQRQRYDSSESTGSTGSRFGNPLQPYRFLARAAEPFHFYPVLHPPPQVIPTSSRSATITRPTYLLQPDPDSEERTEKLPGWLHWDGGELKLWGHPTRDDAHRSFAARVIERTVVAPGSPVKGRSPAGSVEEKTVSRLVVEVAARTR